MSDASYYNDPVCRHGYFRGSETYGYVSNILARWADYRTKIR
jgi:membrane-bound lytic murein transglycosylase F